MNLQLYFLFILSYASLLPVQSTIEFGAIHSWCNQTPYPETCKYYLCPQGKSFTNIQKHKFRDLVIGVAKTQALEALRHIKGLGIRCRDGREKVAWSDCLKLYESTIVQLDKALDKNTIYTDFDAQTWLSAALTNLDTCRDGFFELGVTKNVYLLMSNNVSFLVSNSLAVNKPENEEPRGNVEEFPSWVLNIDSINFREEGKSGQTVDIVVAKDGSGNFKTIGEALKASTKRSRKIFVIYIKKGIYDECFEINFRMKDIMLIGDGLKNTIVTGDKSVKRGYSTFGSATTSVGGDGFLARDITFRNTAGPDSQAVALISTADRSVFYRCSFEGYQDTLFVHSQRQFYSQCQIFGTTDFIFGNAAVVFQNCFIYARQPIGNQVTITAHSRSNPNQTTGISIDRCTVAPDKNLPSPHTPIVAYLGRPWREYARVVYLKSSLDAFVAREGWSTWGSTRLDKLYYGEYGNFGKGSSTRGRVRWRGYHDIKDVNEAMRFSVRNLLRGKAWLPLTKVPFSLDI